VLEIVSNSISSAARHLSKLSLLLALSLVLLAPLAVPRFGSLAAGNDIVVRVEGTIAKVCQLVGDFDRQMNRSTLSLTATKYGVFGTDLGVSFEHKGELVFLFGDTAGWNNYSGVLPKDDSWAHTTDFNPDDGLDLIFYIGRPSKFLPPIVPGLSQGPFEVPMEGIDINGTAYVYFTTNHTSERTMGSSVLARFDDNTRKFTYLYTFSTAKFLNVQVVAVNNSEIPGLPQSSGKGLLIWGSGEYRKSDPYLAYMPLASIDYKSAVSYFRGTDAGGNPQWSRNEADATPLFHDPIIGEFSVFWHAQFKRWIMLYSGVLMRSSANPWGSWSEKQTLFNALREGYTKFIHWPGRDNLSDPLRESTFGGPYGPYVVEKFTEGDSQRSTIYFTLSTWNPYTTVLMRVDIELKSSGQPSGDGTPLDSGWLTNNDTGPPTKVQLSMPGDSDITTDSVSLSWTENTNNDFAKYEMYQSSASGNIGARIATFSDRSNTSYEVTGLSPGTTYYFTVRTIDVEELSADSNRVGVSTEELPGRFPWLLVGGGMVVVAIVVVVVVMVLRSARKPSSGPPPPP